MPYFLIISYCFVLFFISLLLEPPIELFNGLTKIVMESDILITDYIALSGLGPSFLNSALVMLTLTLLLLHLKIEPTGPIIAGLLTTAGFSLFGKNIVNIWPIVFGVWLYSKYQKTPFSNFVVIMLFGTTLAPTVTFLMFSDIFPNLLSIVISLSISSLLGFILPPMASYTVHLHQGYSLANVGLAGGLLGTALASLFTAIGMNFEKKLLWSAGNNLILLIFLIFVFTTIIIVSYISDKNVFKNYPCIFKYSGKLVTDFYSILGPSITYLNIGILGLLATIFVLLIKGDLNGATLSGIFTVAGFGSFGKHPKNIFPVIIGALLGAYLSIWDLNSPGMILGMLFSTALCPIAGNFGWPYGIIAGFMHIFMVMNIGYLHGGMNLYHNGFAAGFVAIILVPLITAFKKEYNE
ncbi:MULTISPECIES: DUF1576 domain-containing protein [Clostridium]|uniref:DUF1576 domain-containing protein n=1 Tax=Clostridium senegalense TaxID=1465809 RepID=A0A6M0H9G9_9CLOT|nr:MULTISPECIES: DUF1576 domain-containing protein [Clostridium]NEU06531.1 DUF1576 domain-containing protein [Clostridium senegalense]